MADHRKLAERAKVLSGTGGKNGFKDRIHRYGLKEGTKTNYYYILSEDSIDETIDARLAEKEHRMNEIMESMPIPLFDNASDDLGDEDIKALIKDYVRRTKKI